MTEKRDTRFRKGQSGNPKGRPRKRSADSFIFTAIFEQKLTLTQNGVERELSVEEAAQLRIVQAALKGDAKALDTVSGWLLEREAWRSSNRKGKGKGKTKPPVMIIKERNSDNAFDAMCLLGIAEEEPSSYSSAEQQPPDLLNGDKRHIKLMDWAVAAAHEHSPWLMSDREIAETLRAQSIAPVSRDSE